MLLIVRPGAVAGHFLQNSGGDLFGRRTPGPQTVAHTARRPAFPGSGWILACAALAWLAAPTRAEPPVATREFLRADPARSLQFPADHRPHAGFRTEWWYYTGELDDGAGRRFGFQFTIFKVEREPNPQGDFRNDRVFYMLHFAVTDPGAGRLHQTERIQRNFPGLAGWSREQNELYITNNTLQISDGAHKIRARAADIGVELDLDLRSRLGPRLQGERGYSRKGFTPDAASHYYSVIDLVGEARLQINGVERRLRARAWMDHEFASNALAPDQIGWDWFHLNLADGRRLMLFRVRSDAARDFTAGALFSADGAVRSLAPNELRFTPGRRWNSPHSGGAYPVEWNLEAAGCRIATRAWLDDQEMRPALSRLEYYEGAIDATVNCQGIETTGGGYMELTGYSRKMSGRI
jgi:predicted secreted hydrolase